MRERRVSSSPVDAEAVLVTGVYGVGKSTVVAQMGDLLEARGLAYAAIDLDWLGWADDGSNAPHDDDRMLLANLDAVARNYRGFGIARFALAGWVGDAEHLARLRATLAMPTRVVWLTAPLEEIKGRVGPGENTGRADDLARTKSWLAAGTGRGLADAEVANDRPVVETAGEILAWLGWT
jgi:hypothetical protein